MCRTERRRQKAIDDLQLFTNSLDLFSAMDVESPREAELAMADSVELSSRGIRTLTLLQCLVDQLRDEVEHE